MGGWTKGNTLLIDTGRADEESEVDPDTGKEIDCERVVDLRGFLAQAPLNVSSLDEPTINIKEHFGRVGKDQAADSRIGRASAEITMLAQSKLAAIRPG